MSTPKYTRDYFIAKFEAIPEEKWCKYLLDDTRGRHCALGHCGWGWDSRHADRAEGAALIEILVLPAEINNGSDPRYQQPTPKQRILAALRDCTQEVES